MATEAANKGVEKLPINSKKNDIANNKSQSVAIKSHIRDFSCFGHFRDDDDEIIKIII